MFDPVSLTQRLIQAKSITPFDDGCMDFIESLLKPLGFVCHRVDFGEGPERVQNFYARFDGDTISGDKSPHLCFLGHTDVVPPGDETLWTYGPFSGQIEDGYVYGRGACDMKGAIACFLAVIQTTLTESTLKGSVSILLTSDEEGAALNGIRKMIPWLQEKGEVFDFCLGGEPTNPTQLGEMIKIGRRGSLTVSINVKGIAGHVAYPSYALNPIPALMAVLMQLNTLILDEGTDQFDPSHLEIISIDVDNPTTNVIPPCARAVLNIRFNPIYTLQSLQVFIQEKLAKLTANHDARFVWEVDFRPSSEAFLVYDPDFNAIASQIVQKHTGLIPQLSTTGGTSDARFMKELCPVLEFGLLSCYAHHVDERVSITDLTLLMRIYQEIIQSTVG